MVVVLLALLGSLWSGYLAYKGRSSAWMGRLGGLTVLAIALQALFGTLLAAGGQRPQDPIHFIVGPLTLFALPAGWALGRGRGVRVAGVLLCAGWLVTLGLSLRATGTGGLG